MISLTRPAPGSLKKDMASQKKFFKKNRIFLSKISSLRNKKNFPGKTPVGISSYICLRNPYAKFEPNRMDSLGDRLFWHPQIQVQKTQTRARSRGPTQPRNLLYRIEIPAPRRVRLNKDTRGRVVGWL